MTSRVRPRRCSGTSYGRGTKWRRPSFTDPLDVDFFVDEEQKQYVAPLISAEGPRLTSIAWKSLGRRAWHILQVVEEP